MGSAKPGSAQSIPNSHGDRPFVPWHPSPVTWLQERASLTAAEKEKILWKNLAELLDIP